MKKINEKNKGKKKREQTNRHDVNLFFIFLFFSTFCKYPDMFLGRAKTNFRIIAPNCRVGTINKEWALRP